MNGQKNTINGINIAQLTALIFDEPLPDLANRRRCVRLIRLCLPPDMMHLLGAVEKFGSGGWIRTSDQKINSLLRYHCATPEFFLVLHTGFEPMLRG